MICVSCLSSFTAEAATITQHPEPLALITRQNSSQQFSMLILDILPFFLELEIILKIYLYLCNFYGVLKNSLIV